jgi:hypothetical protein
MKSQDTKERFIELRARGLSFDKITKELKVAKKTLVTWSKDLNSEIQAAKALEIETLLEKHYLLKEQRLSRFGKILGSIDSEIDRRGLKDVATDKLLELRLKYYGALIEELIEPRFLSTDEIKQEKTTAAFLEQLTNLEITSRSLKVA